VQDALYDAEEYLRSELAENPGMAEADVIASVAGSYGAPHEVAEIYRDTEVRVQTAMRTQPAPCARTSLRQVLRRRRGPAHLRRAVLLGARAGDGHLLLHLGDHRLSLSAGWRC
jgi:hypothetical protein